MQQKNELFKEHLAQTTPNPFGIKVDYAEGSHIYDKDGQPYLDMISGIAVNSLGHGHPRIKQAIKSQLDRHLHVMVYGEFEQDAQNELAEELLKTLPKELDSFYFLNSGTEANEAAIKLAKRVSGKTEIIAFHNSYHGSTHGSMSVSANEKKKSAFRPLIPGTKFITLNNRTELQKISNETAAVILETIQGDAGVRIPDSDFMKALSARCRETNTVLILDEIQCGIGRTGKFWAFEHYGIIPDMVTSGKALGGGMPIGCLITNRELMKQFSKDPMLGHITTFGGHPLVCAAAAECLKIIHDEQLIEQVTAKAEFIQSLLKHPEIVELRHKGLMFAIELESEKKVKNVVLNGLSEGILLFWFLSTPNAFRIAPPLNISNEDLEIGCKKILALLD